MKAQISRGLSGAGLRALPWRRIAAWCAGIVIVIAVLGFLVAPPIVRHVAEKQASQALGRTVTIERVRINPFALSASVEGLRIADPASQTPLLSVARIYANLEAISLFKGGPVLREIAVDQPQLALVRQADGRFNFSDILDRFAARPASPPGEPLHFSLNNLHLSEGRISVDDRTVGQKHLIEHLGIGLPFVSNLPSQVEVFVQPHIEAVVNGAPFAVTGRVRPFADRREATLDVSLAPFDLVRYLAYVPAKLPVRIEQALAGAQLECVWSEAQSGAQSLALRGSVDLFKARLSDAQGAPLLDFARLHVGLQDVQPLATPMKIALDKVALDEPVLAVRRDKAGRINLVGLTGGDTAAAQTKAKASASAPKAKPTPAPVFTLGELAIAQGRIDWQDEAVPGGFTGALTPLNLKLAGFSLAATAKPATLHLDAATDHDEHVTIDGDVSAQGDLDLRAALDKLKLAAWRPYYAAAIGGAKPEGELAASARLLTGSKAGGAWRVEEGKLQLSGFALPEPGNKKPLLTLGKLGVDGVSADPASHRLQIASLTGEGAQARVVRDKGGKINLLQVLGLGGAPAAAQDAPAAPAKHDVPTTQDAPTWVVGLGSVNISGWEGSLEDRTGNDPVILRVKPLTLEASNLSTAPGSTGKLALKAGVNARGRLQLAGTLGLAPLKGALRVDAKSIDLTPAQPYVAQSYRVLITQGALDAGGMLNFDLSAPQTSRIAYQGNLQVDGFNSFDQINDTDFVRWKQLGLKRVNFQLAPLAFAASEINMDALYTRLILDSEGRFNLRELARGGDMGPPAPSAMPKSVTPPAVAASAPVTATSGPAPQVKIGSVKLTNSAINYSDRFVKPNYDANLTELNASLTGLSSDPASTAALTVKAFVDHSAPVDVSGELNPLRQDRYLDIKAHVSDVDLTGVSTYATKYVGYGIDKGKLSMDVAYQIRDRKLTAENHVFLDQLTFGERVDSPDATKLPVLLAVALLKNSRGQIDINLPISGTLDDPDFSVGGIIVRVLVNLVTKAVTAPFALLGSMFGGGEELSYIDFDAGSARLSPASEEKLRNLARALLDRPGLRLEISAHADAARDLPGLKLARLESRLRAVKAQDMVRRGESVSDVSALPITAAERPALLQKVYDAERFDKPRNVLGFAKSLPPDQMQQLILDNTKPTEADLLTLANQRAQAVRGWLLEQGKVPAEHIFLVGARGEGSEAQSTRVDFSLK